MVSGLDSPRTNPLGDFQAPQKPAGCEVQVHI